MVLLKTNRLTPSASTATTNKISGMYSIFISILGTSFVHIIRYDLKK